jgi:hypothetical protein
LETQKIGSNSQAASAKAKKKNKKKEIITKKGSHFLPLIFLVTFRAKKRFLGKFFPNKKKFVPKK